MTQREKLIELICKAGEFCGEKYHGISFPLTVDQLADFLLDNGIVVLPKEDEAAMKQIAAPSCATARNDRIGREK